MYATDLTAFLQCGIKFYYKASHVETVGECGFVTATACHLMHVKNLKKLKCNLTTSYITQFYIFFKYYLKERIKMLVSVGTVNTASA